MGKANPVELNQYQREHMEKYGFVCQTLVSQNMEHAKTCQKKMIPDYSEHGRGPPLISVKMQPIDQMSTSQL